MSDAAGAEPLPNRPDVGLDEGVQIRGASPDDYYSKMRFRDAAGRSKARFYVRKGLKH